MTKIRVSTQFNFEAAQLVAREIGIYSSAYLYNF